MSEPEIQVCPRCGGEGLVQGPRECVRCGGVGVVPVGNVYPIRARGLAKCGSTVVAERTYPVAVDGVALEREGERFVFRHQRGARGFELYLTLAELRDVHEQAGRLLKGVRDGERKR